MSGNDLWKTIDHPDIIKALALMQIKPADGLILDIQQHKSLIENFAQSKENIHTVDNATILPCVFDLLKDTDGNVYIRVNAKFATGFTPSSINYDNYSYHNNKLYKKTYVEKRINNRYTQNWQECDPFKVGEGTSAEVLAVQQIYGPQADSIGKLFAYKQPLRNENLDDEYAATKAAMDNNSYIDSNDIRSVNLRRKTGIISPLLNVNSALDSLVFSENVAASKQPLIPNGVTVYDNFNDINVSAPDLSDLGKKLSAQMDVGFNTSYSSSLGPIDTVHTIEQLHNSILTKTQQLNKKFNRVNKNNDEITPVKNIDLDAHTAPSMTKKLELINNIFMSWLQEQNNNGNVLHLDQKPANILLAGAQAHVVQIDFGSSRIAGDDGTITVDHPIGTVDYLPTTHRFANLLKDTFDQIIKDYNNIIRLSSSLKTDAEKETILALLTETIASDLRTQEKYLSDQQQEIAVLKSTMENITPKYIVNYNIENAAKDEDGNLIEYTKDDIIENINALIVAKNKSLTAVKEKVARLKSSMPTDTLPDYYSPDPLIEVPQAIIDNAKEIGIDMPLENSNKIRMSNLQQLFCCTYNAKTERYAIACGIEILVSQAILKCMHDLGLTDNEFFKNRNSNQSLNSSGLENPNRDPQITIINNLLRVINKIYSMQDNYGFKEIMADLKANQEYITAAKTTSPIVGYMRKKGFQDSLIQSVQDNNPTTKKDPLNKGATKPHRH